MDIRYSDDDDFLEVASLVSASAFFCVQAPLLLAHSLWERRRPANPCG